MAQPNLHSFEEQLQRSADELNFKPSNKVWQGVENSLNNNSTLVVGASATKSLLNNWILNLLVPAVVLVGGGSIFYSNYSTVESTSIKEANTTTSKPETKINSTTVPESTNEHTITKQEAVVSTGSSKNVSENQNNANAVNYSLGYSNSNKLSQNGSLNNVVSAFTKKNSEPIAETTNNSNIVFTSSDIEKISKKELEKNSKTEYQERNLKPVDFTE